MKIDGCVHLIIKDGKIVTFFEHLDKLPKNGVVHLKVDDVYSFSEFKKTHPEDLNELKVKEVSK